MAAASSVHDGAFSAAAACDGRLDTRWASREGVTAPEWISFDFGKPVGMDGLILNWETAAAGEYEIQLSPDGAAWKTVFKQAGGKGGREECRFPAETSRWVRVVCAKPGTYGLYSIWEAEFTHPDCRALVEAERERERAAALEREQAAARERARIEAEKTRAFKAVLTDRGIREVVFALRKFGTDGHWYANFGYYAQDTGRKPHRPFGQLCKLDLATDKVTVLVDDPGGSVRDPVVDYDAGRILFSYRKGGTENFLLHEIRPDGTGLRALTSGPYDDFEPCPLPDGGIAFVSSRCRRWVNCWLTQVATLHRCDGDGGNIRQLSANLEQDNTPSVMPDGRLIYQRWEYVDRSQVDYHHLWTMNPDGTAQQVYFGNMHPGGVFIDARPMPGSEDVLMIDSPGHGANEHVGNVALVTGSRGPDDLSAKRHVPGAGNCHDPFPVTPFSFLVARDRQILVMNTQGDAAEIYRVPDDLAAQGVRVHEPRPLAARPREPVIPSRVVPGRVNGRLLLDNVNTGRNMGGVAPGTVKRLLVMESLPKPINYTGGMDPLTYGGSFTLERILGTVPVEPDGSANFEVPANRALFRIAQDGEGRSVKRMQSFLTVMPGETLSCVGCHEQRSSAPVISPAVRKAFTREPSRIEPVPDVPDVFDYARDIQPVLDRLCVSCHNPDKREAGVLLTGDRGPFYSHSYVTLTVRKLFVDGRNQPRSNYAPYSIGAAASPLMKLLDGSHFDARATELEKRMIGFWIEAGAPYPGTYAGLGSGCIGGYAENEQRDHNDGGWPESQKAADAIQRRCLTCHQGPTRLPRILSDEAGLSFWRPDWNDRTLHWSRHFVFNLTRPDKSLVLLAPLASAAGGYGACRQILPDGKRGDAAEVFKDANDPDYQLIRAMLEAGKRKLGEITRFDMPCFKPRPEYLREMKRYGVLGCDVDPAVERVDPYVLDRRYWDALVPGVAKEGFPRVSADPQTGRVTKFDRFGEPVWVYTRVRPLGAWTLDDGSVLVPYLPSAPTGNRGGVRLVSEAKHTLLDFRLP
ncbi:MAG: discoidin domain-containing protein [Kiritimatiellia bacterium]